MTRLRVAQIITRLDIGSPARGVLYLLKHLNRSLFEPHLITGPGGGLDPEMDQIEDVPVHHCGELSHEVRPLADIDVVQSLRQMLRELKPDLVHTHLAKAGIAGRLAAASEKVPVILHTYHGLGFHRFQPPGAYRLQVALERETNRRSHHLIFVSHENRAQAEELDLVQHCSVSTIRPGVDVEPLLRARGSEEFRKEFGISKWTRTVGMVASLRPQKDPLTFVEAAALVVRKEPDVKFLLFGNGELADAVIRRSSKLLNARNFVYAGRSENVPEVLQNIDLLIVPSIWEGLPRIIPEATISGVPVIASDVDGIREIVVKGKNGVLAEPQNPEDFAGRILEALEDNWKVDSEYSRQIQFEYDIRETLRQEENLYLQLSAPPSAEIEQL